MMNRILSSGLVKDVTVLAGAFAAVQAAKSMQKPPSFKGLQQYTLILHSPLAHYMEPLTHMEQPVMLNDVLMTCESFLKALSEKNQGMQGFVANRLATELPHKVRKLVIQAQFSKSLEVSRLALNYSRDELESIMGVCDNLVRDMLLDSPLY